MNRIIGGVAFTADIVETSDGRVERLTTSIRGTPVQINRQENDDEVTVFYKGRITRMKLEEVGRHLEMLNE